MLLAGDIGGTKTDLAVYAVERGPREPIVQKRYPSQDYPTLEAMAREFIAEVRLPVTWACFAVAGPVVDGTATLTNLPWVIDEQALRAGLGLELVNLLNDVEATATAVPYLESADLHTLQSGTAARGGAIAVVAPGTGLGEAFLTWDGARYHAHPSEGGHVDFGPTSPREVALLQFLQGRHKRVSYERVCSGRGIPELYDFLQDEGETAESAMVGAEFATVQDRTPTIMAAALDAQQPDPLSLATLNLFVSIMGAEAGNLALAVLATGGVYLSGGIPPRILGLLDGAPFLEAFRSKGRLSPMLARVPVHVIVRPVALLGAAIYGLDVINTPRRVGA